MIDIKREWIAKTLLEVVRSIWCDRETDDEPHFNCSKCEFKDGENCRLKLFISNSKYEHTHPQGMIIINDGLYRENCDIK